MADSDVRVTPDMLSAIAAEFADDKLGLATCPYRAVPGRSFWSTLEAVGLNTEFIGGVLVARMLDGMKFALGPTIAARRAALEAIGGFDAVKDFLAEDFVMGNRVAARGFGVILSSYVIEHRIGAQRFAANLRHRLRWNRSTRRSRPWGYVGQVFTNPLPLALILWAVRPGWWPVLAATAVFRAAAGWATVATRPPATRSRAGCGGWFHCRTSPASSCGSAASSATPSSGAAASITCAAMAASSRSKANESGTGHRLWRFVRPRRPIPTGSKRQAVSPANRSDFHEISRADGPSRQTTKIGVPPLFSQPRFSSNIVISGGAPRRMGTKTVPIPRLTYNWPPGCWNQPAT